MQKARRLGPLVAVALGCATVASAQHYQADFPPEELRAQEPARRDGRLDQRAALEGKRVVEVVPRRLAAREQSRYLPQLVQQGRKALHRVLDAAVGKEQAGRDDAERRVGGEEVDHSPDGAGEVLRVGIEDADHGALHRLQGQVARVRRAPVTVEDNQADTVAVPRAVLARDVGGSVAGPVVDDDELEAETFARALRDD
jgi:hypothetical protein